MNGISCGQSSLLWLRKSTPPAQRAEQTKLPQQEQQSPAPKLGIALFSIYSSDREGNSKEGPSDHFSELVLYGMCFASLGGQFQ